MQHIADQRWCSAVVLGDDKRAQALGLGAAVSQGIIANETLAYFIGRTWLLFLKLGVDPQRMRFRYAGSPRAVAGLQT